LSVHEEPTLLESVPVADERQAKPHARVNAGHREVAGARHLISEVRHPAHVADKQVGLAIVVVVVLDERHNKLARVPT
jgi:hypothetical protein